ncbi:WD-repeat domain [Aureococcus anophagefferens]|uniref:WD-repeat domain n=1 Tax=Aureococcus anophagefferens TaxID=44056 RepID=A0ABR1G215_AURAN
MLAYAELGSKEVVYVAFSGDSKFCLTQGGAPEWQLVLWTFDRAGEAHQHDALPTPNGPPVYQADFCPQDSTVVCVTGDSILRFMRITENQFRPIPFNLKREPQNYLCHCWLPGTAWASSAAASRRALRIFERSDDVREYFKCSKVFNIEGNATHITNLAISPSEENLLCATANNQIGLPGQAAADEPAHGRYSIHQGAPVKGCRECKFAHGGHAFAVVNNSLVQIIHTYTCEVVTNLRGHNARVTTTIAWRAGDRRLATVGADGALFIWKVRDGSKEGEHVIPRVGFLGGAASPDLSRVFSVSDDATLGVLRQRRRARGRRRQEPDPRRALGCVDVGANQRILFAGTAEPGGRPGFILAHALLPQWEALEPQKYQCHWSEVSCLRLSHDGTFLFSGGHDGSLCMFEVHDVDQRGQVRSRRSATGPPKFTEEILVTKSDLEEKSNQMQQLRNKVDELVLNNEYQLRLKDMKYKERLTETSDKFTFTSELQSDAQRARAAHGRQAAHGARVRGEAPVPGGPPQGRVPRPGDAMQYDAKINTEVARYQALVAERETQNRSWDEDNLKLVDGHSAYVMELTSDYDAKIEEEHDLQRRGAAEKESMLAQFNKTKALIEEDADLEVEEVKSKYEAKLAAERQLTLRLKGENGLMKKKFSALTKDVEDQKEEIRSLHEKEKELIDNIKGLEKDIQGHKKEIREREETIADKEKRIYDLKKKNQELEKFKFVLDYKIKELKRQIEPRENEIADMRKQVEEMDMELEQYHKSNSALDLMIGELRLKMDGMQKEINLQRDIIAEGAAYISRFRRDLSATAAANLDKHKDLKLCVRELYKTYVLEEGAPKAAGGGRAVGGGSESDLQAEYNRQREHLERNVEALKRKIAKDLKMYYADKARLTDEGVTLVDEMNNLRRENHRQNLKQGRRAPPRTAAATPRSAATSPASKDF